MKKSVKSLILLVLTGLGSGLTACPGRMRHRGFKARICVRGGHNRHHGRNHARPVAQVNAHPRGRGHCHRHAGRHAGQAMRNAPRQAHRGRCMNRAALVAAMKHKKCRR